MTKHMTATEARRQFFAVLKVAEKPGMTVTITHEGRPTVIVMSLEEFEGWQETLDIMSDPEEVAAIRKALDERETISLEDLEASLHAGSAHVPHHSQKVGRKAVRKATRKRSR